MGIIIRQSIKGTVVTYIGAFIGFLTTFFVSTKFLAPEEIGLAQMLLSVAMLISGIAVMGLPTSGVKFFPYFKNYEKNHNGFFFYTVVMAFFGIILTFILALLFKDQITLFFSKKAALFVNYFYVVFPLAFFYAYLLIFEMYSAVLMRVVVPKFVREVLIRIVTLTVFLLYAFRFISLDWMIYLYVCSYVTASLIDFIYISKISSISLKHNTSYIKKPLRKYIFSFTGYMVFSTLSGEVISRIDMFMVTAFSGLAFTGIYSIALFMANIIEIPSRSLASISMPLISSYIKEKKMLKAEDLLKRASLNQFLIGAFIFMILWINIDNVYGVLPNGEVFAQGKMVVLFLGLARLSYLLGNLSFSTLSISKYYYYTLFFVIFLSALTIFGNYILIPKFGMTGASISTLASIFIYYSVVVSLVNWKLKINPFSKGMLKVIVLAGGLILLNSFIPMIMNYYIDAVIRSFLLGGIFIFVTYFWNISPESNNIIRNISNKFFSYFEK